MSFYKDKPVLVHLALASAFIIIALWIILKMIASYANHNDILIVPDLSKMAVEDVDKLFEEKNLDLKYEIIDTIYKENFPKGVIAEQDPISGSKVKPERIIYLTVTSKTKEITKMPNLIDLSLKQATTILESNGLRLGRLEYVKDIAENAVLRQQYKGHEITAGSQIEKGATINLVVGKGINNKSIEDLNSEEQAE
ncbi:MAG: PASTA domain-containing protein [Bacteroidota bacterium]